EKTLLALKWCHGEMEFRYKKLADAGVRDITEYNKIKETEKIPFLVVLIDELADLMTHSPKQAEEYIIKLSQMARAVGIHLVLSTQRPSKVVLPPMLRANIFTTMAFQVVSKKDSEKLLYMAGAETLRGTGDMLFSPLDKVKPIRIQAPNIEEVEISATAQFITISVGRTMDRKI
ncbi:MAG: FtsK/SpoIIIE domain-containing protein, partial [Microgenomates group bacterium]